MILLKLIQWLAVFLNSILGMILGILSFIIALTGIASLLFGMASGQEVLKMMAVAFLIFLIPHIGNWIIERITVLGCILGNFIRSRTEKLNTDTL